MQNKLFVGRFLFSCLFLLFCMPHYKNVKRNWCGTLLKKFFNLMIILFLYQFYPKQMFRMLIQYHIIILHKLYIDFFGKIFYVILQKTARLSQVKVFKPKKNETKTSLMSCPTIRSSFTVKICFMETFGPAVFSSPRSSQPSSGAFTAFTWGRTRGPLRKMILVWRNGRHQSF